MKQIVPDHSARPYACSVEATVSLGPDVVYQAFTEQIDRWFASPGRSLMSAEVDLPFFFETEMGGQFHAHYGRFIKLVPGQHVQMTWMTGDPGTKGAETLVTLDLTAIDGGTLINLNHAGFADSESCDGHALAWPEVFKHLDSTMRQSD